MRFSKNNLYAQEKVSHAQTSPHGYDLVNIRDEQEGLSSFWPRERVPDRERCMSNMPSSLFPLP